MLINSLQQRHSFVNSHHVLFLSLIRETKKNETSTTPKVEKGCDHSLSRGGEGGGGCLRRILFASP